MAILHRAAQGGQEAAEFRPGAGGGGDVKGRAVGHWDVASADERAGRRLGYETSNCTQLRDRHANSNMVDGSCRSG